MVASACDREEDRTREAELAEIKTQKITQN